MRRNHVAFESPLALELHRTKRTGSTFIHARKSNAMVLSEVFYKVTNAGLFTATTVALNITLTDVMTAELVLKQCVPRGIPLDRSTLRTFE